MFPALAFAEWLPAALADLFCAIVNLTRGKGSPLHRDDALDAWGLHMQAAEFRKAQRRQREEETQENLVNFVRSMKGK